MSALKSQSSLLRFGFGQTKDTVPGLVDPNLPEFGPKPKPVSKRGPDRPRKEAKPDNDALVKQQQAELKQQKLQERLKQAKLKQQSDKSSEWLHMLHSVAEVKAENCVVSSRPPCNIVH